MRTAAQKALHGAAGSLFTDTARHTYSHSSRHQDFEALVRQVTGASFNQITREMIDTPAARGAFEAGKTAEGDYAFDQPLLVTLLRAPKPR